MGESHFSVHPDRYRQLKIFIRIKAKVNAINGIVIIYERIRLVHLMRASALAAVKNVNVVNAEIRAIGGSAEATSNHITVRPVKIEEHLVILLSGVAHTGTGRLGMNVIQHAKLPLVIIDVQPLHQTIRGGIQIALLKRLYTAFRKDLRFLKNDRLRRIKSERSVADAHIAKVKGQFLIQDEAVIGEPVPDDRVEIFIIGALPVFVQAKFYADFRFRTRLGGEFQVRIDISLIFTRRGAVVHLAGRYFRRKHSAAGRSVHTEAEDGHIERIQFFHQAGLP